MLLSVRHVPSWPASASPERMVPEVTAIQKFDELWEELFPAERVRILGLLVEGVEYEASVEEVKLRFR